MTLEQNLADLIKSVNTTLDLYRDSITQVKKLNQDVLYLKKLNGGGSTMIVDATSDSIPHLMFKSLQEAINDASSMGSSWQSGKIVVINYTPVPITVNVPNLDIYFTGLDKIDISNIQQTQSLFTFSASNVTINNAYFTLPAVRQNFFLAKTAQGGAPVNGKSIWFRGCRFENISATSFQTPITINDSIFV